MRSTGSSVVEVVERNLRDRETVIECLIMSLGPRTPVFGHLLVRAVRCICSRRVVTGRARLGVASDAAPR